MIGFFISGDEVRIKKAGETTVTLETYDGRRFENLEPMRLFPVSGITKYISLTDETGKEVAIIRDIDHLMPDSAEAIRACLASYYIVPKIKKILSIEFTNFSINSPSTVPITRRMKNRITRVAIKVDTIS